MANRFQEMKCIQEGSKSGSCQERRYVQQIKIEIWNAI